MDPLSIYCNEIWQDALRPKELSSRPYSWTEQAAFTRLLKRSPRPFYSAFTGQWLKRAPTDTSTTI